MQIHAQAHTTYQLLYHLVWVTKFRRKYIKPGAAAYCKKVIIGCVKTRYPDVHIEEVNVQLDHVHILITIPPKYSLSTVVGRMKSDVSKGLKRKFAYVAKNESTWSTGYFVSSLGLNEETIRKYVKYQSEQDKGQAISL